MRRLVFGVGMHRYVPAMWTIVMTPAIQSQPLVVGWGDMIAASPGRTRRRIHRHANPPQGIIWGLLRRWLRSVAGARRSRPTAVARV
ncbi:hypothetical protein GCM10010512_00560 [Streptomyces thermoviolaceus subsp. thermoviolaceus]|nr:hypothetical protein GCM10010499_44090 [Streptomyces thermoviolaceus subsp. apingens]GHA74308.1 hypothetical protein GCM10010512_00560 [Streptomyces thermoviolaceus subsp. thermoviolaceus]